MVNACGEYELRLVNGSLTGIWKDNLIFLRRIKLIFTDLKACQSPVSSTIWIITIKRRKGKRFQSEYKWNTIYKVNTNVFKAGIYKWHLYVDFNRIVPKKKTSEREKRKVLFWYTYILLPQHHISRPIVKALGRIFIYTVSEKYVC